MTARVERTDHFSSRRWSGRFALSVVSVAAVCVLVLLILANGGSLRELVIAVVALVVLFLVLMPTDQVLRVGFYIWILTFAVGWRQIDVTTNLKFHPSEPIIWLLVALLIARRLARRQPLSSPFPFAVTAFLLLGWVGLFTALTRGTPWDVAVSEFKLFLVIIPIVFVTFQMVANSLQFRNALLAMGATALYISALGVGEYFFPSLLAPVRGILGEAQVLMSEQNFARADFSFWGGAIVSVYLSMMLIPLLSAASAVRSRLARLSLATTTLLCSLAVYASGNRGPWLATGIALSAYVLQNWRKRWWLLLMVLVPVFLAPAEAVSHFLAAFDPVQYYDTSVLKRQSRLDGALLLIQQSPLLGHGWGGSGWVHSDPAQIAANLGVPALLLFGAWYGSRMWRLWLAGRKAAAAWPAGQLYAHGLLAGLLAALVSLSTEAIIVLPPLIIPLWFLLALADRLCAIIAQSAAAPVAVVSTSPSVKSAPAFRPYPYLQQRVDPPKLP